MALDVEGKEDTRAEIFFSADPGGAESLSLVRTTSTKDDFSREVTLFEEDQTLEC